MFDTQDRPGIEESYQVAGNTSDLTVEADRRGAADVLIAAGWSPTRIGAALMRLHSEYDAAQRKGEGRTDVQLLRSKLRSLSSVTEQLALKAFDWRMEDPKAKAQAVALWWLDRSCRRCTGRKFELTPGAPALSNRACKACSGTGETRIPHGQEGRRLAIYLDDCVSRARQSIKNRLRQTQQ